MKVFFMSIFCLQFCLSVQGADLFDKGCDAFEKGDYKKASEQWQSLEEKTPATWFNLALAAHHLNKKVDAIVYWLRAWHQGQEPLKSQSLVHARDEMRMLDIETSFLKTMQVSWWGKIPVLFWQILVLIALLMMAFCAARLARKKRWYMLGALTIFILIGCAGLAVSYAQAWYEKGIIVKEKVSLYSGPDEQFEIISTVPMGSLVTIRAAAHGWYKVRYHDRSGWVVGTTVALLEQTQ